MYRSRFLVSDIYLDSTSGAKYQGIISGNFNGIGTILLCEEPQEGISVIGKFVARVHMTNNQSIYIDKMNNLLKLLKKKWIL